MSVLRKKKEPSQKIRPFLRSRIPLFFFSRGVISRWIPSSLKPLGYIFGCFIGVQLIGLDSALANLCRLKKQDERNVCLSRIEDTDYYCRFVRSSALNYLCYAIAQRKPKVCLVITDPEIRSRCETGVQERLAQDDEERKKRERLAQLEALKKAKNSKEPQSKQGQQPEPNEPDSQGKK